MSRLQALYHHTYLEGYSGRWCPRWLRRWFAGTELHRAWLTGFLGIYTQGERRHGVIDRVDFRSRKQNRTPRCAY